MLCVTIDANAGITAPGGFKGNADTAIKLTASAGSATQPVYFSDGKPVATTYTLGASVPSGAKFTDTTYAAATTSSSGLMSSADKTKLDGITAGANKYTHPTTAGNKHIPSGGSSGQILRWSADGTAVWGADNNTTYGVATSSANGLMSATDKAKLDGITASADSVSFTRSLTSGTKIGAITINGVATDLYCQTNTNTDTKVNVTLGTTTKAYLLGTSTAPTATATGVTAIADTGVYLDTAAGKLVAGSFSGNGASITSLNASNISSGTISASRLPAMKWGTLKGVS